MDGYIFELSEQVTRKPVSYKNRFGIDIEADLYVVKDFDESKKHAAILVGPPYSGVKEQGPGIYAQEMAKKGYVVVAFDPSYNGYSGGEPRHISSPEIFVEDFSAGVDYLGTRPFVDREKIGVIGICGSGGFALSAAQIDPRIKAVATSVMYDISMAAKLAPKEEQKIQLKEIAEQRYIDFEAGHPAMAPKAQLGSVDAMDPVTREFAEFYQASRGYHHNSTTQFSLTSNPAFMNFSLLDHLEDISPRPILLIVGENAHSRFFSDAVYKKAQEPKEMYVVPGANHVDLYDKTDLIPFDKLDEFFTDNLK